MSEWVISVAQLNEYVRRQLAADPMLRNVSVRGEISGFKRHISGHLYFSLKDAEAKVNCVMFRTAAQQLDFRPEDGMQVIIEGSASMYVANGAFQIYCERMRKEGVGDLFLRFEQLKQKLLQEGLFDASVKKEIPYLPKRVGIVTSRTGAALRDMVRIINRRFPGMPILLAHASVQGATAASEIAEAIDRLNENGTVDVILCGRGGGSIEDLWAFNEEEVVRAIYRSAIPVISCVGHETDTTIADFVADVRAATPSMAAELAVPELKKLRNDVQDIRDRLNINVCGRVKMARMRLDKAVSTPTLSQPGKMLLQEKRARLNILSDRLQRADSTLVNQKQSALLRLQGLLKGLDPEGVLERGYALVEKNGKLAKEINTIRKDDMVRVRMKNGAFVAHVTETEG